MDRATEIAMLQELLELKQENSFFMQASTSTVPVDHYTSADRFAAEQSQLFRALPLVAAQSNEIANSGDFVTRNLAGVPALITRGADGVARAFINVCRHRGAELVGQEKGCKRMFSCPYHAWTYSNEGELKAGPHLAEGFPDLIQSDYNLKPLPMLERAGLIWVVADPQSQIDIEAFVAPLIEGIEWSGMPGLAPAICETFNLKANWKILIEGGIEAYHFRVVHRKTIGPHFLDNLSNYRMLGEHSVNVLAKNSLATLREVPQEDWHAREHSNVIFSSFPLDSFLLMEDHLSWIHMRPISANETEIRLTLLAPVDDINDERMPHWQQNHDITKTTLMEDWTLNESIQRGAESGANSH